MRIWLWTEKERGFVLLFSICICQRVLGRGCDLITLGVIGEEEERTVMRCFQVSFRGR